MRRFISFRRSLTADLLQERRLRCIYVAHTHTHRSALRAFASLLIFVLTDDFHQPISPFAPREYESMRAIFIIFRSLLQNAETSIEYVSWISSQINTSKKNL